MKFINELFKSSRKINKYAVFTVYYYIDDDSRNFDFDFDCDFAMSSIILMHHRSSLIYIYIYIAFFNQITFLLFFHLHFSSCLVCDKKKTFLKWLLWFSFIFLCSFIKITSFLSIYITKKIVQSVPKQTLCIFQRHRNNNKHMT